MEELVIITMITVIMLTCRRNSMEKKISKQKKKLGLTLFDLFIIIIIIFLGGSGGGRGRDKNALPFGFFEISQKLLTKLT